MKNIFVFALALLVLNLVSCKSCNSDPGKPDAGHVVDSGQIVDVFEEPAPKFQTIEGDVWSIDLPGPWYKDNDPIAAMADLLAINDEKELVLVLMTSTYEGTYDQFMINRIRELRGGGFAIADVAVVSFGCSKYILLDVVRDGVQGYMWFTVTEVNSGGKTVQLAFDISCGGELLNPNDIFVECSDVVKSFKIKNKKECHLR